MSHTPEPPRKIHADRLADAALRPDRPERLGRPEQAGEDVRDLPRHPADPARESTGTR
ncbi:MAG TPA: hypothetical protein VN408_10585 [Actinoplanes sp.]|nr:hypothetical protein [Actinoplanes sp.]